MESVNVLPISVIIPVAPEHERFHLAAWNSIHSKHKQCWFDDIGDSKPFRAGVCYARNTLIAHAHADLILPLDADDRLFPDALERLYAAWQPGTWVYGNYVEIDEQEQVISDVKIAPPPGMLKQKNLTFSTFLFHRNDWKRAGGYDPDFEFADEDYAFQCALTHHGVRPVRLDGAPLYKRMIHPGANGRTEKARRFWSFAQQIARERWPGAFL